MTSQTLTPSLRVHDWATDGPLGQFLTEEDLVGDTWRFADQDGEREDVRALARRYLLDVVRYGFAENHNEFIRDMIALNGVMTSAQTRGVVNTLGGAVWANRQRFKTTLRRSREYGREPFCIVCGRHMRSDRYVQMGIGFTCWRRVLGDRLDPR